MFAQLTLLYYRDAIHGFTTTGVGAGRGTYGTTCNSSTAASADVLATSANSRCGRQVHLHQVQRAATTPLPHNWHWKTLLRGVLTALPPPLYAAARRGRSPAGKHKAHSSQPCSGKSFQAQWRRNTSTT